MRTVGLITARGGSKRLPRKNVLPLAGKPLIRWTVEAALESGLDAVYCSTDDDEIAALCSDIRVIERPPALATDDASSIAVIKHAIPYMDCYRVMLLQPTSPQRTAADIDACLKMPTCVSVEYTLIGYRRNGAIYLMLASEPMEFEWAYIMRDCVDIDTEADFEEAARALGAP